MCDISFLDSDKKFLLQLARKTIKNHLKGKKQPDIKKKQLRECLLKKCGCFVTLHTMPKNALRGCMGYLTSNEALYKSIIENSINAALHDSRFAPVRYDELKDIEIEISVLSIPKRVKYSSPEGLLDALVPLRDGVILKKGRFKSTFLPQVWEQVPDKEIFLKELSIKAGIEADAWKKAEIMTYTAAVFKESYFNDISRGLVLR